MEQKKVLIVEDELPLLDAVRIKFTDAGVGACSARTAEEALALLEAGEPVGAVWLDHYLIGSKDGLEVVAQMKENEKYKHIPVFVVSNTATQDKIVRYIELGVEKYYVKSQVKISSVVDEVIASMK